MNIKEFATMRKVGMLLCAACLTFHFSLFTSCSESDDESADDYANWQQRNETFVASLQDSVSRGGSQWKKLKCYTKDENTAGQPSDYVYVKVLEQGTAQEGPIFSDTVRISYRGRLIPTANYPEGLVFDQTYSGTFHWQTTGVTKNVTSGFLTGFTTALLYMHPGDRWRVYIPYQLGYGTQSNTNIPAYSTLCFDIAMIQYWHPGEKIPAWTARASSFDEEIEDN